MVQDLIPEVSAKPLECEAQSATGVFLPGFTCPEDRSKPELCSERSRKAYGAFLASEFWRALRGRVFIRGGGRCERADCGSRATEIHHLTYARFGGKELISDLEALCAPHHRIADVERRQELYKAIRLLALDDLQERAFNTWMISEFGERWDSQDDWTIEEEREKFEAWWENRRAQDSESEGGR